MEKGLTKEKLESLLIDLWENGIKNEFIEQGFMWERHFQAVFYHRLREMLVALFGKEVGVWIEPVFKIDIGTVKPDIIITYGTSIVCILELKFKVWENVPYEGDIEKLYALKEHNGAIALSVNELKNTWTRQEAHVEKYEVTTDCLMVFAVVGRYGSGAFDMKDYEPKEHLKGLLRLNGFIDENDEVVFISVQE